MTRRLPASPIAAGRPLDPLWYVLFPGLYVIFFGYGAFAAIYYIPQLRGPAVNNDPALAQIFGILVAIASALGLAGALVTIFRRHDGLELIGTAAFVVLMVVYFLALTLLVGIVHDPGTRPGSAFVPMAFGWVGAIRWAVIVRDRKLRTPTKRAAQ